MDFAPAGAAPEAYPPLALPTSLRIAFLHPDLGLGGAERLVVDAALALQQRGHDVHIFTSYHEPGPHGRSFPETRDGTLPVHVLGGWLFPRSFAGRFTIVCAILRQLHLVASFLLAGLLHHLAAAATPDEEDEEEDDPATRRPLFTSLLARLVLPLDTPFASSRDWSPRRQLEPFDVLVLDQLSTAIPLLRWFGHHRVVFYCHFPDLLLSPSSSSAAAAPSSASPAGPATSFSLAGELRKTYRAPIDALEMATTGEADKILVNSHFTATVFERTFPALRRTPRVVYPAVQLPVKPRRRRRSEGAVEEKADEEEADDNDKVDEQDQWLISDEPLALSINRFEGKKDLALALEAFALARSTASSAPTAASSDPVRSLRLVLAGGYDPRLADNVRTLAHLQQLAARLGLSSHTYACGGPLPRVRSPVASARFRPVIDPVLPTTTTTTKEGSAPRRPDVLFLLNITARQKALLLDPARSGVRVLLYTPMYEHFGIVPLEAMAAGVPVLATTTGGPTETVVDRGLGYLDQVGVAAAAEGVEDEEEDEEEEVVDPQSAQTETTGLLRPRDPHEWATALTTLVSLPTHHRRILGRAGQRRVRTYFSLARLGVDFERACRDAAQIGMPIPNELGYKKMLVFFAIGSVCFLSGVMAYWIGRREGP